MLSVRKPFYSYLIIILISLITIFYTFRYIDQSYIISAGQQRHQTLRELIREEPLLDFQEQVIGSASGQNSLVHILRIFPDLLHIRMTDLKDTVPLFEFGGYPADLPAMTTRVYDREKMVLSYEKTSERWFLASQLLQQEGDRELDVELVTDISAYIHASRPMQRQFMIVVIVGYFLLLINLMLLWKRFRQSQEEQTRVAATYRDRWQESTSMLEAAEEHIMDAQSWRSRLLDNMSHELRTPLNAIIGYTEMVQEELPDNQKFLLEDLNHVKYSARHLLGVISDLLDVAKLESGEMNVQISEFFVKEVIDDLLLSVRDLAAKNDNQIKVSLSENVGMIRTDLHKFRQALFNILSNACKYTRKGQINIEVQRLEVNEKEHIVISVTDNGIGMSRKQLDKALAEFPSADMEVVRKYGGIGIGLTITRYLSLLLGGEMRIDSKQGEGTSVTLDFPADLMVIANNSQVSSLSEKGIVEPENFRFTPIRQAGVNPDRRKQISSILVIDDDPTVRESMRRQLNQSGFRVVGASTGAEGLELAQQLRPDVITLDANLPGLDGWTVLKKLKNEPDLAEIPVVMLTFAYNKDASSIRSVQGVVRKPVLWPDYIDLVRQCVRKNDDS